MRWKGLLTCMVAAVLCPLGALVAQTKFTVSPENQPSDTASPETMKLYSAINQKLADGSDKPVSTCVQSYAVYQACKGGDAPAPCGLAPTCKVTAVLPRVAMGGIELVFTPGQEAAAVVPAEHGQTPQGIKMIKRDAAPPDKKDAGTLIAAQPPAGNSTGAATGSVNLPKGPVRIAGGVIAGSRTNFVQPAYPADAKAAHLSGTVVMHAVITKDGSIQQLQVMSSSNGMFDAAAIDAVRQWRYRPFLLNGELTEVSTTITVNFALAPPKPPQNLIRQPNGTIGPADDHNPGFPH